MHFSPASLCQFSPTQSASPSSILCRWPSAICQEQKQHSSTSVYPSSAECLSCSLRLLAHLLSDSSGSDSSGHAKGGTSSGLFHFLTKTSTQLPPQTAKRPTPHPGKPPKHPPNVNANPPPQLPAPVASNTLNPRGETFTARPTQPQPPPHVRDQLGHAHLRTCRALHTPAKIDQHHLDDIPANNLAVPPHPGRNDKHLLLAVA